MATYRSNYEDDDFQILMEEFSHLWEVLPESHGNTDVFHWDELLLSEEILTKLLNKQSTLPDLKNIDPTGIGIVAMQFEPKIITP